VSLVKLTAGDQGAGDEFGFDVVVEESTAVLGAHLDDDVGSASGSAYVFERMGSAWVERAKLCASDAGPFDRFGWSVALCGDTLVVGSPNEDGAGMDSGAAYVFARSGTLWTEEAKLTSGDAAAFDHFGYAVSVSGDTALVGACGNDDAGPESGSAYVFRRTGSVWIQEGKLTAAGATGQDRFGQAVCVDGDTALVGACGEDDAGSESGAVHAFERNGSQWARRGKLTASDGSAGDWFGCAVSVHEDLALVGALYEDAAGANSGSAYVFERAGSTWSEQAKLSPADAFAGDVFGCSVSIQAEKALVGAFGDDDMGNNSGSAYLFVRAGPGWAEDSKLVPSDGAIGDVFGSAVSLSGGTALVGAYWDDDGCPGGVNCDMGSAYVFSICPGSVLATESVRVGNPPNPNALLPGCTSRPIIGEVWDPVIDHTSFAPGAILDFVAVDTVAALNYSTPMGTLLITPPPPQRIYTQLAGGQTFEIPVPDDCSFVGVQVYAQGGAYTPAPGPGIELTNALDLVLGTY
jgi:hypothetical protein